MSPSQSGVVVNSSSQPCKSSVFFRPIFVICLKIITQVIISHDYDKFAAPLISSDVHIVVNDIAKFLFVCVILLWLFDFLPFAVNKRCIY